MHLRVCSGCRPINFSAPYLLDPCQLSNGSGNGIQKVLLQLYIRTWWSCARNFPHYQSSLTEPSYYSTIRIRSLDKHWRRRLPSTQTDSHNKVSQSKGLPAVQKHKHFSYISKAKYLKINIYRNIIFFFWGGGGCESLSLTFREEHRLRVF